MQPRIDPNQSGPVQQPQHPMQLPPFMNPNPEKPISDEELAKVHVIKGGEIPDVYIANKVRELTGKEFNRDFANKDGFKIHCGFRDPKGNDPKDAPRDIYIFDRNGEEHFGVRRYVSLEWNEGGNPKQLTFSYNIELGLKVPQKGKNIKTNKALNDAMDQGKYMAGVAGKMASEPWELMIRAQVGQADQDPKWRKLKEHVTKIREDRFVTLELLSNEKSIKMDGKNTFKTRDIQQVILHVRGSPSRDDIDYPGLHLSSFKTDLYRVNDQRNKIYGDKFKRTNWNLVEEPLNSDLKEFSSSTKHYIAAQNLDNIRNAIQPGNDITLRKVLKDKDLNESQLLGSINSQQERLQTDFNDYLYKLSDRNGLQSLVDRFADRPVPNLKDDPFIETSFTSVKKPKPEGRFEKVKAKVLPKEKEVTPESGTMLHELLGLVKDTSKLSPSELKTLSIIAHCSKLALEEMDDIHKEMVRNDDLKEDTLNLIGESDAEGIKKRATSRTALLRMLNGELSMISQQIDMAEPPVTPKKSKEKSVEIRGSLPQREPEMRIIEEGFLDEPPSKQVTRLSPERIKELVKKAEEKKNVKAQMELAAYYEAINEFQKARNYYNMAAKNKDSKAIKKIKELQNKSDSQNREII